jgi:hypothetical protein
MTQLHGTALAERGNHNHITIRREARMLKVRS